MSEKLNTPLTPEEIKRLQDIEDQKALEAYLDTHPEPVVESQESIEAEAEMEKFNELITTFEATHSLEALYVFSDITPENVDAINAIREPARLDLIPIVAAFQKYRNTNYELYVKMREKYMPLSRAVGIINNKKIHHDR